MYVCMFVCLPLSVVMIHSHSVNMTWSFDKSEVAFDTVGRRIYSQILFGKREVIQ